MFLLGVVALLATNLLHQYIPRLLKHAIDILQDAKLGTGAEAMRGVLIWACCFVAAVAVQGLLRYGWRMGFFGMGRKVEYELRRSLFEKLLSLNGGFFRRLRVGDLLSRAMSDLATVRESLGFGWMALFDSLSMIAFTLVFMMKVDARLSLLVLLPMAAIPPLVMTLGRRVRDNSREAQGLLDGLSQTATESFSGVRVIHAFARQEQETARFNAASSLYRAKNLQLVKLEAVYWPLLTALAGLSELLLFLLGGQKVALHEAALKAGQSADGVGLSLGDFYMMQEYLLNILWPVMALGFSTNMYIRGKVSVERLNEVLDARPEIAESPQAGVPEAKQSGPLLQVRGLGFRFDQGPWVLQMLELDLAPGEWLGLAGRTGAGKTSLLRLLARLEDPNEGSLSLDGQDLRLWPLADLRRQMGLVAQEPFLFSETVLENITFGWQGPPQEALERAQEAAKAADFHETAVVLPQGYDSLLGEKGVNLSGGQKQRLALARALFIRPRLLLLDDAFSAVDTATEERIVARLRASLPGTAVLMVSHRVSTLKLCDRVACLEGGRLVQEGKPAELLLHEGLFLDMARRERLAAQAGLELED